MNFICYLIYNIIPSDIVFNSNRNCDILSYVNLEDEIGKHFMMGIGEVGMR